MRVAYTIEYGREPAEQSSLNLITLLKPDTGNGFQIFGPPGGGKSALYGSVATYVAAGRENRHGFKIKMQCAAVFFAMERADLVRKRIWAECQRQRLDDVPVAVCARLVNLMDPNRLLKK